MAQFEFYQHRFSIIFSPRQHICLARYMLSPVCQSVYPSVCPSDGCIIEKRLKLGLWNFHHMVAYPSGFCRLSFIQKFQWVPPSGGVKQGRGR